MIKRHFAVRGLASTALLLGACVKQYEAPLPDQPHAVVKVRRAYASHAGVTLSETAFIGGYQVMAHSRLADLDATETTAVRVHPGAVEWQVDSEYSHIESKQVLEHYTEQEPYTTQESYNCGSGTSQRTCYRSATHYRTRQKQRWVTKQVTVVDAKCGRAFSQLAEQGHVYLLQYSYTAHDICSLVCLEQLSRADGQFDTKPCKTAPKGG